MIKNNFILTALSVVVGLMFYATPSEAVHKGAGGLTCGQCHTMHNSQGRSALNVPTVTPGTDDTSMILLRGQVSGRQNIHNLCLQCHGVGGAQAGITQNGSNVEAPKVYLGAAGVWQQGDAFTTIGSGGDFTGVGTFNGSTFDRTTGDGGAADADGTCANNPSLGKGHSIGCKAVPPGADMPDPSEAIDLSCTACHDPHGADKVTPDPMINVFRNLRKQPIGGGGKNNLDTDGPVTVNAKSAFGGVTGRASVSGGTGTYQGPTVGGQHIWPIFVDASQQNAYAAPVGESAESVSPTLGIGAWCAQCHDKWHESIAPNRTAITDGDRRDWKRHPVDNPLVGDGTPYSSAKVEIIKFSHYRDFIQPGFKVPAAQSVPVASYATEDLTGETYYANEQTDKVFCFSCHFVHGSPYNDILRWDYTEAVELGSQKGKAIESNIGCQQCHNR